MIGSNRINLSFGMTVCVSRKTTKKGASLSYGVPGHKRRILRTPLLNKNAHTRLSGANIFYRYSVDWLES